MSHNNKNILLYALCVLFLLSSQVHIQSAVAPQATVPKARVNGGLLVVQYPKMLDKYARELRLFESLDLYVETSLVVRYPAAYYFFVNSENKRLANAIELGLKRAIADGDFDVLFNRYFSGIIKRARLDERTIIPLSNRIDFPMAQEELWFDSNAKSPPPASLKINRPPHLLACR